MAPQARPTAQRAQLAPARYPRLKTKSRITRGFSDRDNYRLGMLLIGGGLATPTSSLKSRLSTSEAPVNALSSRVVPMKS